MPEEKTAEQIKAEMDKAAEAAAKQLKKLAKGSVKEVAEWMKSNLAAAGYKRLGKALVATLGTTKPAATEE